MSDELKTPFMLPEAPSPSPEARRRAVDAAMAAYDEKFSGDRQGLVNGMRPSGQAGNRPAAHKGHVMKHKRWAVAASLLVTAGIGGAVYLDHHEQAAMEHEMASLRAVATVQGRRAPAPETGQSLSAADSARVAEAAGAGGNAIPSVVAQAEVAAPAAPQAKVTAAPAPFVVQEAQRLSQGMLAGPAAQAQARAPAPAMNLEGAQGYVAMLQDQAATRLEEAGRDRFAGQAENPFKDARAEPVSTFSLDVDTASYSFVRSSLTQNLLPPKDGVRTEELVNYFPYDYPAPASAAEPFRTTVSVFPSPWNEGRKMVHVGIKGYAVQQAERPKANLVFLVDTSGSMAEANKLPLVKQALSLLVQQLGPEDRVAIVAYAGSAGTVLEPTPASEKGRILAAIERLGAAGGTAGGEGIRQAYALAEANFAKDGVNRVMLATDGDFNVGIANVEELKGFVERKRDTGIYLSVLGFGRGNYNDALMQALAQNGNGAAAYIDTLAEARKVLVEEATSTLVPIAKDVKIQVEFNPALVAEYRLVGYETRALRREDFNNDKVDAGEVGSGSTVTALYEVVPAGGARVVDDLRYGQAPAPAPAAGGEMAFLKMRYKLPDADASTLVTAAIPAEPTAPRFQDAPREARFATAVAGFGELLRGGRHTGRLTFDDVVAAAQGAKGEDPYGYRGEFVQLARAAKTASALPAGWPATPGQPMPR